MITALLLAAVFAAGCLAGWLHANGFLLHALAWMRGGQWFTPARVCPGCGRAARIQRWDDVAGGNRCLGCSSGSASGGAGVSPGGSCAAPDRPETARVPLASLLGRPKPQDAAESRTSINDERTSND